MSSKRSLIDLAVSLAVAAALAVAVGCSKSGNSSDFTPLFNGKDFTGWRLQKPGGWKVEDGAMALKGGGGYIWTTKRYGDFILDCEFKITPGANSGIFFRTDDINDEVQTGIEMQVLDSYGKDKPDKHDCGAIYDCLEPSVNACKPAGEWNHVTITCKDNLINVVLNGKKIIDMDLNKWDTPHMNPDGTKNKFNKALKDFSREGYIGFQDHGHDVWYRNVKIKVLD